MRLYRNQRQDARHSHYTFYSLRPLASKLALLQAFLLSGRYADQSARRKMRKPARYDARQSPHNRPSRAIFALIRSGRCLVGTHRGHSILHSWPGRHGILDIQYPTTPVLHPVMMPASRQSQLPGGPLARPRQQSNTGFFRVFDPCRNARDAPSVSQDRPFRRLPPRIRRDWYSPKS